MANTYHQVYVQFVFAVKYREAIIEKIWRQQLLGVIGNLVNETGCKSIIANGIEDHVHCFVGLKPTVSCSDLMKTVKANSSKYINDHQLTKHRFEWQEGFGVFSYGHSQIDRIYKYIANQEKHHKQQKFMEEYQCLLEEFEIPYDARYVFQEMI